MFEELKNIGWELHAWAVFPNHCHLIAFSNEKPQLLREFIRKLHSKTAREINKLDQVSGRKVWYQYWDKCIRDE